jgi:hypothetical protein
VLFRDHAPLGVRLLPWKMTKPHTGIGRVDDRYTHCSRYAANYHKARHHEFDRCVHCRCAPVESGCIL